MSEVQSSREEVVAEYNLLSQLLDEVRKRIDLLNATLTEISASKSALDEVQVLNEGEELMVPLGAGVYARAKLASKNSMLVSIGAGLLVERNLDETRRTLENKEQRIRDALQRSLAEYQAILNRLRELEQKIRVTK
ncbi:MAG: prefoldin subunit alpha [Thermofilaceae archaeon]|nr:prefoldin subunit alpha [Thermofilaceae archaeon]MCX8180216.1 prefoldin subunit alpha [Thermofilaceae archaeon]MDW8003606.1 prefoldin subunit alpha [Thermofilaceae archaeon]